MFSERCGVFSHFFCFPGVCVGVAIVIFVAVVFFSVFFFFFSEGSPLDCALRPVAFIPIMFLETLGYVTK